MDYIKKLNEIIESVVLSAKQNGKISMFSIASTSNINNPEILFPAIRETKMTVCGNILISTNKYIKDIIKEVDGVVDVILIDSETKVPGVTDLEIVVRNLVKTSKFYTFKPNDITVEALDTLIAQLKSPLKGKKIAIIGAGNIGSKIALKLVERGADVCVTRRNAIRLKKIVDGLNAIKSECIEARVTYTTDNLNASSSADVLIGATPGIKVITAEMADIMKPDGLIIDVGNGTLFPEAIEQAKKRNIRTLCLFMKPGYDGALETILQTERIIRNQTRRSLGNFSIISGGVLGERGDIIVDNAYNPTKILAIADGKGDVIPNIDAEEFQHNLAVIQKLIKEYK